MPSQNFDFSRIQSFSKCQISIKPNFVKNFNFRSNQSLPKLQLSIKTKFATTSAVNQVKVCQNFNCQSSQSLSKTTTFNQVKICQNFSYQSSQSLSKTSSFNQVKLSTFYEWKSAKFWQVKSTWKLPIFHQLFPTRNLQQARLLSNKNSKKSFSTETQKLSHFSSSFVWSIYIFFVKQPLQDFHFLFFFSFKTSLIMTFYSPFYIILIQKKVHLVTLLFVKNIPKLYPQFLSKRKHFSFHFYSSLYCVCVRRRRRPFST